jgi:OFA family oxalate/formate antiporter-like MFS transporter
MLLLAALCGFSVWFIYAGSWWVILVTGSTAYVLLFRRGRCHSRGRNRPVRPEERGINYGFLALGMSVGSVGFPLLARCFEGEGRAAFHCHCGHGGGLCVPMVFKAHPGRSL